MIRPTRQSESGYWAIASGIGSTVARTGPIEGMKSSTNASSPNTTANCTPNSQRIPPTMIPMMTERAVLVSR